MSELKARRIGQLMSETGRCDTEVYLKSEADKVIAEKDAEIARLKAICKVHIEAIESMGAGLLQNDEEIRHQKYKRCLAMADKCAEAYNRECGLNPEEMTDKEFYKQQIEFWPRWNSKWLKIAEKFKEAK